MSKFKDPIGRWFTVGMFHEYATNPETAIYHIEEAKQLYLDCGDITGYRFSTTYLGGWKHWLALHNSPILEPILKEWEEELEVKLRSEAVQNIVTLSKLDKGYQAAKYLADRGWKVRESAGRPSKEEIQKETRVQSKMYDEFKNVIELKK